MAGKLEAIEAEGVETGQMGKRVCGGKVTKGKGKAGEKKAAAGEKKEAAAETKTEETKAADATKTEATTEATGNALRALRFL